MEKEKEAASFILGWINMCNKCCIDTTQAVFVHRKPFFFVNVKERDCFHLHVNDA